MSAGPRLEEEKGVWRCFACHSKPQNCLPSDLGPLCASHRDDIFEFPPELGHHHDYIRNLMDAQVHKLIEFRCEYVWFHEELGGQLPKTSPTSWYLTEEGCHIFSKIDFSGLLTTEQQATV